MIFPYLGGLLPFRKAPVVWFLVFLQIVFFSFVSQMKQDNDLMSLLSSEAFLETQGKVYSEFIIDRQPAYTKEHIYMAYVASHSGDLQRWIQLGQLALQDPDFSASAKKPLWVDNIIYSWWQERFKKLQQAKANHPSYILGVSASLHNWGSWLTYQFVHHDFMHLFTNLIFLIFFGAALEIMIGSLATIAVFIAGGLLSAGSFLIFESTSTVPMIGASGSVSAVIALFCALNFKTGIRYLYFLFIPQKGYAGFVYLPGWLALLSFLLADAAGFWASQGGFSSVAHVAHLGGQATGILVGLIFFILRKQIFKKQWPESPAEITGPAFKVVS